MVPGYLTPPYLATMMLNFPDNVFSPMTCYAGSPLFYPITYTAGMSFISHIPLCGNQLYLISAQEVPIRNIFPLLCVGKVFIFPAGQDPLGD